MRRICRYLLLFILPIIVGTSSVWAYNTNPPGLDMEEFQGVVEAYKAASVLPEPTPTIVGSPELHKPLETSIFEDDFEGGAGSWTIDANTAWEIGALTNEYGPESAASGSNVAAVGLSTVHTANTAMGGVVSPAVTIPDGYDVVRMEFKLWYMTYYAYTYAEISSDGGSTWNSVLPTEVFPYGYVYDYEGSTYQFTTRSAWNTVVCDLTDYAGSTVQIRFRVYASYASNNNEPGVFIDDVKIAGYEQGDPLVAVMPTYYTWPGEEATLWGSVTPDNEIGSFVNSSYQWDFGDGSAPVTGTVTDPNFVVERHTYSTAGTKTATLTIDPTGTNNFAAGSSRTVRINVGVDNLETRRLKAIEDGLRWIYTQAHTNGHIGTETYWVGETGLAVLAFEEQGHHAKSDITTDIYSPLVKKGLDAIVENAQKYVFADKTPAAHPGDPDTNGNGYGYYLGVDSGATKYTTGVCMLTIIASRTPDEVITGGAAAGDTYRELIQDICDYYAFVQSDTTRGSTRGGWRYNVDNSGGSDNSAAQWPALGMMAAEQEWGCTVPAWVKSELRYWLDYSQADNGGYTYAGPGNSVGMTGAALCQWAFVGENASNEAVSLSLDFLNEFWDYRDGRYGHFNGNFYSLYAVAKGCRVMRYPDGSQINLIGQQHNWWNEYVDHLVNDETYKQGVESADPSYDGKWRVGYWNGASFTFDVPTMQNSLSVLVLSPGVFELPPVAAITGPEGAQPNVDVGFSGASSYHQDPQKSIVEWLWDFDASDGIDWQDPDAVGQNVVVSGGWDIAADADTIIVTLRVKDNSAMAMYDTEEHKIIIGNINHAPIAVAGGPYASQPGEPIQLDATGSYDPDPGDVIVTYEWDLDGDGEYDDSNEPNPVITWNEVKEGLVGLRVWDADGLHSSDESPVYVSIWTSERDIAISQSGLLLSNESPSEGETISLSVSGTYVSNDDEVLDQFNVRFYNGNPDSSFILIGDYTVENLSPDQSFTATMNWTVPAEFKSTVWVKIDSNDEVNEYDELNNSDNVYIGGAGGPKVVQLFCDPDPAKIISSGAIPSIVSVSIRNAENLFGTEIKMNFDQTKVNVVSINPGSFFSKDLDAPSDFSSFDNDTGTLTISLTRMGGDAISGTGSIADVKFVGTGVDPASLLTFDSIKLRDELNNQLAYDSSDDGAFEGISSLLGDFDDNMTVDFIDYTQLIVYWNAGNTNGDIVGTGEGSAGSPPWSKDNYPFAPDGVIDFEDQIVFALMYNWYLEVTSDGVDKSAPMLAAKLPAVYETGIASSLDQYTKGASFTVTLNPGVVEQFLGAEMVLGYDPSILRVSSVTTGVAGSREGLRTPVEYKVTKNGIVASTVVLGNVPDGITIAADNLFEIEFEIIGEGVFGISLESLDMRDCRNNPSMVQIDNRIVSGKVGLAADAIPLAFGLDQNYPNPFNMSTTIGYSLKKTGTVEIKIYNSIGQEIRTLVSGISTPGRHTVMWDGTNDHGDIVTSGVYFVRLHQGELVRTSQLLLIK